jgi:hypothetical protein
VKKGKMKAYPDAHEHDRHGQRNQDGTLEPQLAVLEVETHLDHVSHELGLAAELLAHGGADGGLEGTVCTHDSCECGENEISDRGISIKADIRWLVLCWVSKWVEYEGRNMP